MGILRSTSDSVIAFFKDRLLRKESKANLDALKAESDSWKPSPTFGTFRGEMKARQDHYLGSMQADMREVLERHYPQNYKNIEKDQVNLPCVRKEIKDKAKVFVDSGDVLLVNEAGDPQDSDAFDKLKRESMLWAALKDMDAYTQLMHRACFKPWWDQRAEHVRCSVWPIYMVHIVPDPYRWWDMDSAHAVLFELPGIKGLASTACRYEVWGQRNEDEVKEGYGKTVHFVTDGNQTEYIHDVNDNDENPFVDPRTGGPIYPFVLWQDDNTTDLYVIGDEDLLTVGRQVNSVMTDMNQVIRFCSIPMIIHTMGEGGEALGLKDISPGKWVDLPTGATVTPVTPTLNIAETWTYTKELMETRALFSGLAPSAVRADAQTPESGYHVKLRNKPLLEHRANLIDVYRPYVEESVYRLCVVHNTYAGEVGKEQIPLDKLRIKWIPGEVEEPDNPEETGRIYSAEIEGDVSTAVDWRMARYDESREEAEKAIQDNIEFNKSRSDSRSPLGAGMADQFANDLFKPEEEEEPKEEEETEEEEE